jgi:hypothetical protein
VAHLALLLFIRGIPAGGRGEADGCVARGLEDARWPPFIDRAGSGEVDGPGLGAGAPESRCEKYPRVGGQART